MSSVARPVQSSSDVHTQSHRLAVGAARRIAKQLTRATWIVAAFGIFYPHPYWAVMAILVALPLIAVTLFVRKSEMYQIIDRKHDLRACLVIPFMMPAINRLQFLTPHLDGRNHIGLGEQVVHKLLWCKFYFVVEFVETRRHKTVR
jgi:hypothetical protein